MVDLFFLRRIQTDRKVAARGDAFLLIKPARVLRLRLRTVVSFALKILERITSRKVIFYFGTFLKNYSAAYTLLFLSQQYVFIVPVLYTIRRKVSSKKA